MQPPALTASSPTPSVARPAVSATPVVFTAATPLAQPPASPITSAAVHHEQHPPRPP